jgi:recombinational DNA repair protein RecR
MKPLVQEPNHVVVSDPNEMAKSRLDVVIVIDDQKEIAVIRKKPTRKGRYHVQRDGPWRFG